MLTNTEMVSALRHMFGLNVKVNGQSVYCKCGQSLVAGHSHTCRSVIGPATTARHNVVASELCRLARLCCLVDANVRPRFRGIDERTGQPRDYELDVAIYGVNGFNLGIDVSFIYGESESYLPKRFDDGMSAAKACRELADGECKSRDRKKVALYGRVCADNEIDFRSFVMESHGYCDGSVTEVLEAMAKYATYVVGSDYAATLGYMKRCIAIAIQRGNARLDREAMDRSHNSYGSAVACGRRPLRRNS